MERFQLEASVRRPLTKGERKRLRQEGRIPAVVYGKGKDNVLVSIDGRKFASLLQLPSGLNTIVDLRIDGGVDTVMVKDLSRDIFLSDKIDHVDFIRISLTDKIEVQVPVLLTGEARGVKEGGILQQPLREITIKCLPAEIPEHVELDVSELEIGQHLSVADLPVMAGVEVLTDPAEIVVTIEAPREEEAAEATEEGEAGTAEKQEENAEE